MARTASTKLNTRAARAQLAARAKPYNLSLGPGRLLGYIKPAVGAGRWVATVEVGRGATGAALRRQGALGLADDLPGAGGDGVLTFSQALSAAADWQPPGTPGRGRMIVRQAIESYITAKKAASSEVAAEDARGRLALHALREDEEGIPLEGPRGLGDRPVGELTLTELRAWRDGLVEGRSRSTVNRIIANLKAALNFVFADEANGIASDAAWRRLESFADADRRREDHFSEPEIARLIREARKQDKPFADLLTAGFYTGARYGELAALDVRHFDAKRRTLVVPSGKTGRRVVTLTEEATEFFAALAADRDSTAPLLIPIEGGRWQKSMQHRRIKAALATAGLPKSASFYTLRHTHISRAIERGMPLTLVAENVGTSVKMIEKNYGKFLTDARRKLIERTAPRLRVVAGQR